MLNRQKRFSIVPGAVTAFCAAVLGQLGLESTEIAVMFVSPAKIREFNRRYRQKDNATDVLSFAYPSVRVDGRAFPGEIVLSPEVAWENVGRRDRAAEREIRKLLVHGILHLLGYDHETDGGEMLRLQRRLLSRQALRAVAPLADLRSRR